jgi:hypothetical protein
MAKAKTALPAVLGLFLLALPMPVRAASPESLPTASAAGQASGAGSESPEAAVKAYLGALQSGDLAAAYEQLTPQMRRDQAKERWVAEQTLVMKLGEVKISSFQVFPARTEGADKAKVPNLLKSKDKYINQTGADEFELYTVVKGADGRWHIDQQELVETDNVSKWFPPDAGK